MDTVFLQITIHLGNKNRIVITNTVMTYCLFRQLVDHNEPLIGVVVGDIFRRLPFHADSGSVCALAGRDSELEGLRVLVSVGGLKVVRKFLWSGKSVIAVCAGVFPGC